MNGTLLAETDLFYSNNFRLLSCTVSELFEWDRENVIVTGSSDGIIRVGEYCRCVCTHDIQLKTSYLQLTILPSKYIVHALYV